jgi:hypothetical protein
MDTTPSVVRERYRNLLSGHVLKAGLCPVEDLGLALDQ